MIRFDDGEHAWIYKTTVDGLPLTVWVGNDEPDAGALLEEFAHQLPRVWGKLYSTMDDSFAGYGQADTFPPSRFLLNLGRSEPHEFTGDKSSLLLRFEFEVEEYSEQIPIYDFFLTDSYEIVHHQVVF